MGLSLGNERTQLWVWKFKPVLRQGGIARFFFKEDLNEFDQEVRQFFIDGFKAACAYVGDVRVYETYIAVQWNIEDNAVAHEDVAEVVAQTGCQLLSFCFEWVNPHVDFSINSNRDVRQLALREGCPERWMLG